MKKEGRKKILVINLAGIGDLLLSIPALRALRNLYPQAEISMLITPKVYEIVKELSYMDKFFTFNVEYGGIVPSGKILRNFKTLLTLRKKQFDMAINMRTLVSKNSAKKIKLLLNIIKPEIKTGRDTENRGCFFDIKIPETDIGTKHEMEYDIDIVKALGVEVVDKNIDFEINEESIRTVNVILKKEDVSERDILIGIHPGGMPSRRWPIENFSRIMEQIPPPIYCKFVLTGGKDEVNLVKRLKNITKVEMINLANKINLSELSALIKRCNLYISNDTGPMHIAAILKTPLIAIFGPGDIVRFDPGNIFDKVIVLHKKAECAPCNKVRCDSMECLKVISPEEVVEAALRLMQQNS